MRGGHRRLCRAAFPFQRQHGQSLRRRAYAEDKLLDCWIGLEALFTENAADLTLRAALRIAQFHADLRDRKDLFSRVSSSYRVRSRIIHGDEVNPAELGVRRTMRPRRCGRP